MARYRNFDLFALFFTVEEVAAYLIDSGSLTVGEVPLVEMYAACYSRSVAAEDMLAAGGPGCRS